MKYYIVFNFAEKPQSGPLIMPYHVIEQDSYSGDAAYHFPFLWSVLLTTLYVIFNVIKCWIQQHNSFLAQYCRNRWITQAFSAICGLACRLHMMWLKLEPSQSFIWHYTDVKTHLKKDIYQLFAGYYYWQLIHWCATTHRVSDLCELQSISKVYFNVVMNCTVIIPRNPQYYDVYDLFHDREFWVSLYWWYCHPEWRRNLKERSFCLPHVSRKQVNLCRIFL
jgi:hypothetical protein